MSDLVGNHIVGFPTRRLKCFIFQDLSLYVNEVKRDNEALLLIQEIQNSIVDLQMVRYHFSMF